MLVKPVMVILATPTIPNWAAISVSKSKPPVIYKSLPVTTSKPSVCGTKVQVSATASVSLV